MSCKIILSAEEAVNGFSIFLEDLKSSELTYLLLTEIKSKSIKTVKPIITKTAFNLFFKKNHKTPLEIKTKTKERIVSENNIAFLSAITASKKPGTSLYCCASLSPSNVPNICAKPKPAIINPPKTSIALFKASCFSLVFNFVENNSFNPKTAKIGTHNSAITCIEETALNLL